MLAIGVKERQFELSNNRILYKLTWKDISDKLYEEFGVRISADYIRHEHYALQSYKEVVEQGIFTKILVLSDQHYPFTVSLNFLSQYKGKVDILVINGDEQDCQAISKYPKYYREPFMKELIGTRRMLIKTIEMVEPKKVIFTKGNHNTRFIRYFASNLDPDILSLLPETNLDLIVNDGFYDYDHKNKVKVYYEPLCSVFKDTEIVYNGEWYEQVGQTVFAHPEAYKGGIMATAEKCSQYFNQIGLEYDTIVLGHTHQIGFTPIGNKYLFESGCLCKGMTYRDGKLTKPQMNGYLYLMQDEEGKLLFDKSKIKLLGGYNEEVLCNNQ